MKKIILTISMLTLCSTALADNTGKSTANDIKQQKYFSKYDINKDDKLSALEHSKMVQVSFEKKNKSGYQKEADKRFKFKDQNEDGLLTFEEYKRKRS